MRKWRKRDSRIKYLGLVMCTIGIFLLLIENQPWDILEFIINTKTLGFFLGVFGVVIYATNR